MIFVERINKPKDRGGMVKRIISFVLISHSLVQQTFTESLLCARRETRCLSILDAGTSGTRKKKDVFDIFNILRSFRSFKLLRDYWYLKACGDSLERILCFKFFLLSLASTASASFVLRVDTSWVERRVRVACCKRSVQSERLTKTKLPSSHRLSSSDMC